jgi:hypothetical protein
VVDISKEVAAARRALNKVLLETTAGTSARSTTSPSARNAVNFEKFESKADVERKDLVEQHRNLRMYGDNEPEAIFRHRRMNLTLTLWKLCFPGVEVKHACSKYVSSEGN